MKTNEKNKEVETIETTIGENGKLNSAETERKIKYEIQSLMFEIDNLFDAIYHTTLSTDYNEILSDEDLKCVVMSLAKIGKEKVNLITATF